MVESFFLLTVGLPGVIFMFSNTDCLLAHSLSVCNSMFCLNLLYTAYFTYVGGSLFVLFVILKTCLTQSRGLFSSSD